MAYTKDQAISLILDHLKERFDFENKSGVVYGSALCTDDDETTLADLVQIATADESPQIDPQIGLCIAAPGASLSNDLAQTLRGLDLTVIHACLYVSDYDRQDGDRIPAYAQDFQGLKGVVRKLTAQSTGKSQSFLAVVVETGEKRRVYRDILKSLSDAGYEADVFPPENVMRLS